MKINSEILSNKWVCCNCIGESHLSSIVSKTGKRRSCSYCGKSRKTINIEGLADRVEKAFGQYYRRTSDQPDSFQSAMLADKDSDFEWYREGECTSDAIMSAANIPINAVSDVQDILSGRHADFEMHKMNAECEFDDDAHYKEIRPNDRVWWEEWCAFEKSLKYEARYFNRVGVQRLKEIFGGIDNLSTLDGRSLVISVGPGANVFEIYRARVFQSEERLCEAIERPDLHMANPPPKLAVAGRMNAHGVSVFYGATDPQTAIAEVRPIVGSQVIVARFTIEKELRLLDLTTLDSVFESGSIFDEGWASKLERAAFLKTLSQRMTRPVMPDDEALEYLPTQAIADFLASENDPKLDGILFPSVQTEGKGLNIVLFQRSARVAPLDIPEGMSIKAWTGLRDEDELEPDYWVTETLTKNSEIVRPNHGRIEDFIGLTDPGSAMALTEIEPKTLKIDIEGIFVHVVRRVHYECIDNRISRTRIE